LGVDSFGAVVSGEVRSGRVVPPGGQPAGAWPVVPSGVQSVLRPPLVVPPLEFGVDVCPGLVVVAPESDVELESARRIVPVDEPSSSAERMLEHPVSAIPSAAASAIQVCCFISPPLAHVCIH
jgi:hypothetical protein